MSEKKRITNGKRGGKNAAKRSYQDKSKTKEQDPRK